MDREGTAPPSAPAGSVAPRHAHASDVQLPGDPTRHRLRCPSSTYMRVFAIGRPYWHDHRGNGGATCQTVDIIDCLGRPIEVHQALPRGAKEPSTSAGAAPHRRHQRRRLVHTLDRGSPRDGAARDSCTSVIPRGDCGQISRWIAASTRGQRQAGPAHERRPQKNSQPNTSKLQRRLREHRIGGRPTARRHPRHDCRARHAGSSTPLG